MRVSNRARRQKDKERKRAQREKVKERFKYFPIDNNWIKEQAEREKVSDCSNQLSLPLPSESSPVQGEKGKERFKYFPIDNNWIKEQAEREKVSDCSNQLSLLLPSESSPVQREKGKERFKYFPIDNNWIKEQAEREKVSDCSLSLALQSVSSPLPLRVPTRFVSVTPDGNCYFRCISYILHGTEQHYHSVRQRICDFLVNEPQLASTVLPVESNGSVNNYLQHSQMCEDKIWATEVEIEATALMLQTDIFVYTRHGRRWTWIRYSARQRSTDRAIYIYHKNLNHFDVVLEIQGSPEEYVLKEKSVTYTHADLKSSALKENRKKVNIININRYKADSSYKEGKKDYGKKRYSQKMFRQGLLSCRKMKYSSDENFRTLLKLYSKGRYANNTILRKKKINYSRVKYKRNKQHREKKMYESQVKYKSNEQHRNKVRQYSKDKYKGDEQHQVKVRRYSKEKYSGNKKFKDKVCQYSKDKYKGDEQHRIKVLQYSKEKYNANKKFKEAVRKYSKQKYKTFTSFRNGCRASSIKKYASNPLFRSRLKEYLKCRYRTDKNIRQRKKQRVLISRRSVATAIRNFKKSVIKSPVYVCTVCIRILYRKQVKLCDRGIYSVNGVLSQTVSNCLTGLYVHSCEENSCESWCALKEIERDKEWICHTCHSYLKADNMPPQAMINGLNSSPMPEVLKGLNPLERQLISLRIPFMKLLSLPRGGQKGVKGPVISVPSDVNSVTESLPRNMEHAQFIQVKLKRKLSYKGHYKYQWINPDKVVNALRYLQENNPLYTDVQINQKWFDLEEDANLIRTEENMDHDREDKNGDDEEDDSESDDETDNRIVSRLVPTVTCLQPIDIAQDCLDFDNKTLCLAPAEKQSPASIFEEKDSDLLAFPVQFPDGKFGLNYEREKKLSPAKYFNSRLFCADSRFADDKEFIFYAQYLTELNYITSHMSLALRKGKSTTADGKQITASMVANASEVGDILKSDAGYRFLQPVRGTPPYWQRTLKDLHAMIRQLGIPTWFVTFSAAETRWSEVVDTLLKLARDKRSADDLEWIDKCRLISDNSVICARMFHHRVKSLISNLITSKSAPIGEVVDMFFRVEFQQRGSPHIHCLFWIKDAPKLNENSDKVVVSFIDKYVTCMMPDAKSDPELQQIVSEVQVHSKKHSKSCTKYSDTCRFHFPRPPLQETIIARVQTDEEHDNRNIQKTDYPTTEELDKLSKASLRTPQKILSEIWALVTSDDLPDLTFPDILRLVNISYEEYEQCLKDVITRNTVYLTRDLSDVWVNNYNEHLLRAWNANIDIQFVTDAYACVAYILSYISKAEKEMGEILQNAKEEAESGNSDALSAMRKIGNAYMHNREVSSQEAVYRVCGLPLKQCSRDVIFVPAGSNIVRMTLPISAIRSKSSDNEDSEDIWMTSIHEKYYARPANSTFEDMCLAEFCSKYRILYGAQKQAAKKESQNNPVYELQGQLGYIQKRKDNKEAVIRFPRFSVSKNPEEFYLTLLQLYLPHRTQFNMDNYEEYVKNGIVENQRVLAIVDRNRHHFEIEAEELNKAWEDMQEGRIPEESWGLAPEAEVERMEIESEKETQDDIPQEPIPELTDRQAPEQANHTFQYQAPTYRKTEIRKAMRSMNERQREIFFDVRNWCCKVTQKEKPDPFHIFLTGGAGTGKSHLIKCLHYEASRLLSKCTDTPDAVSVLLTAPTGTAAFNIGGLTVHSAFSISKKTKLPYQPLGENLLNTLRSKFNSLHILIIDEISMVDRKLLMYVSGRLSQIKHSRKAFGNVAILAVGDFYQLPPVRAMALYKSKNDDFLDLWNTYFCVATLTEVMRQKEDTAFADMLNRLRVHKKSTDLNEEDLKALESVSYEKIPEETDDILHIFPTNKAVDLHNDHMIEKKCNPIIMAVATDYVTDTTSGRVHEKEEPYSSCSPENLQTRIKIGVGARVMLIRNLDTSDGLVNGAFGKVTSIETKSDSKVTAVYIHFDDPRIGRNYFKNNAPCDKTESIKIKRFEETLAGKNVTRKQIPLKLGWASTIHKVQGMTVKKIVVSLKHVFAPGMSYVALSRATSLSGLHILHFSKDAIYSSDDITEALQKMPQFSPFRNIQHYDEDTFKVILHNTEGIIEHIDDIEATKEFQSCNIICFTETWIVKGKNIPSALLSEHIVFMQSRQDAYTNDNQITTKLRTTKKGGVALFIHKDVESLPLSFNSKNIEIVASVVKRPVSLIVCVVYRPPIYPLQMFVAALSLFLIELDEFDLPIVISGDFNHDVFATENKDSDLFNMFSVHGYTNQVETPTTEYGTCLDLFLCKGLPANVATDIVPTHYGYHDAVRLQFRHIL